MLHQPPFAAMTARASGPPADPFLRRVILVIDHCVEAEWVAKEAARNEAATFGWTAERRRGFNALTLTPERLAKLLDGMSEAKLRRALVALGAPPPGELIRKARLRYAAKLLTHTRLLVKQVAERVGYRSEKHFTDAFRAAFGDTPSEYRRKVIENHHTQGDAQ